MKKVYQTAARAPFGPIFLCLTIATICLAIVTYVDRGHAAASQALSSTPHTAGNVAIAEDGVEERGAALLSGNHSESPASPSAEADVLESPGAGTATLSWTPPTEKLDGSPFRGIANYRIDYGLDPAVLERTIEISNPGIARYVVRV